jgi:predicted DNA-binding protein
MATRQNSSNGKQKSPRIQVVLPEELCEKLSELAETESRTVSNMAKVLIQEGIKNHELKESSASKELETKKIKTQNFINSLEKQKTQRLKGIPKRLKFKRD